MQLVIAAITTDPWRSRHGTPSRVMSTWVRGAAGEGRSLSEVLFAPRKADAPEGDGYLLAVASVPERMCSELVVMDAQRLGEGVIARVILPFRAHSQVHGQWVARADLEFPDAMTVRPTAAL